MSCPSKKAVVITSVTAAVAGLVALLYKKPALATKVKDECCKLKAKLGK